MAFLRVGEFAESGLSVRHIVCRSDLLITSERNTMHVTLRSSKTDQLGHKTHLEVSKHKNDLECPISNMQSYLDVRPNIKGTLFLPFKWETSVSISSIINVRKRYTVYRHERRGI